MANPAGKKSFPLISNLPKKTFKVFAVFFHGQDLEAIGEELVKNVENGSNKKILAVRVTDPAEAGKVPVDESVQVEQGMDKCAKRFESTWKTLETKMDDDLRQYWNKHSQVVVALDAEDEEGVFEEAPEIIIPKRVRNADMKLFDKEIENMELELCDFYIILFGKISTSTLLELIMKNVPLQAVIHFVQCPEIDLEISFPELYIDIDFWKQFSDTKDVGIFIESWIPVTEYLEEQFSNDIYEQFIWYLYDIEMLRQQFTIYQTDFVEINDATSTSQEQLLIAKYREEVSIKDTSDDIAVGVYLNNLFHAIEDEAFESRLYSFRYVGPFLQNHYEKIIVEKSNKLVQSTIANQMNMEYYWRIANMLVNAIKPIPLCGNCYEIDIQLPPYYELLSFESFAQRLDTENYLYDECCSFDIAEDCKLYILRRIMNEVVEVTKKCRVPTKLCFRDFCNYIAPGLGDIIRHYKEQIQAEEEEQSLDWDQFQDEDQDPQKKKLPKFWGLNFHDTLLELTVTDKVYRFENGSIRCSLKNWMYEEIKLTIEIRLYDCIVYAHRWKEYASKIPRLRIITKNNVTCNVELNDDPDSTNISILWPNDCEIRYFNEDCAQAVEQRYHWKRNNELKRLFIPQGCVINYLMNDIIEVLTPNGIIYELYPRDYTDVEACADLGYFRPLVNIDIAEELAFVRSLHSYGIDCEYFDVTRSDGRKLRILNGEIIEEKAHFLIYEWTDFRENEWYAERDDGVKMIWSSDSFKCYYTCGTVITTTVVEDSIEMHFGCLKKSTENILRKINPTLVERVANKAKIPDTFVTYNVNYLMQHKNYASVAFCGKDNIVISSPDELKLIIKENNLVLIDIGETLTFCVTSSMCTIVPGASMPKDKHMCLRLSLQSDAEEIIAFRHNHAFLTLNAKGEMILTNESEGISPYEEKTYFLAKRNMFGMAFLSEEKYGDITTNLKGKTYLYDSPSKAALFKPFFEIDTQFSMPMPKMGTNLEKFKIHCHRKTEEIEEKMERLLTARVIHKLESALGDLWDFVQSFDFTEATLENHLTEALDYFLGEKIRPESINWKNKIQAVQEDIAFRNQRKGIYSRMLHKKVFPGYFEFTECNEDLNLYDVNKIIPRLGHISNE